MRQTVHSLKLHIEGSSVCEAKVSILQKGLLKLQNMLTIIMESTGKAYEHFLPRP
jgi:hypothetical protein